MKGDVPMNPRHMQESIKKMGQGEVTRAMCPQTYAICKCTNKVGCAGIHLGGRKCLLEGEMQLVELMSALQGDTWNVVARLN
eukprot:1154188-Pelagomonas_calceolata.AAC.4